MHRNASQPQRATRRSVRWLLGVSLAVAAAPATAKDAGAVILEAAPLRGLMGHPAVRAELLTTDRLAFSVAFESADTASERQDFKDQRRAFSGEGLWYPWGAPLGGSRGGWAHAPFIGAGLGWEEADIGRQRPRDTVTWARTTPGETHDLWVNHESYLTASQSVGYRVSSGKFVTTSLRLVRDEVMTSQSRVERDAVYSRDPDLSSTARRPVNARLVLHAGLLID